MAQMAAPVAAAVSALRSAPREEAEAPASRACMVLEAQPEVVALHPVATEASIAEADWEVQLAAARTVALPAPAGRTNKTATLAAVAQRARWALAEMAAAAVDGFLGRRSQAHQRLEAGTRTVQDYSFRSDRTLFDGTQLEERLVILGAANILLDFDEIVETDDLHVKSTDVRSLDVWGDGFEVTDRLKVAKEIEVAKGRIE